MLPKYSTQMRLQKHDFVLRSDIEYLTTTIQYIAESLSFTCHVNEFQFVTGNKGIEWTIVGNENFTEDDKQAFISLVNEKMYNDRTIKQ